MIRRTTWVLLGALAVVVVGFVALGRLSPAGSDEATATPAETVWTLAGEEIESFRVVDRVEGKLVVLARDPEHGWRMLAPSIGPADAGRVEMALASLLSPRVRQRLGGPEDLQVFGLDPVGKSVTVFLQDGTTRTLEIGDVDPTGSVYYVRRQGEADLLLVARFSLDEVLGFLAEPPVSEPTATPSLDPAATGTPQG